MRVSDFHFDLPEELIAQHPPVERGASRMLVLGTEQGTGDREQALTDAWFRDLPEFLRAGDLLVLNDSRVLPARLFAVRAGVGTQAGSPQPTGLIEVLLVEQVEGSGSGSKPTPEIPDVGHPILWKALVKPAKKVRIGETLRFYDSDWAQSTKGPRLKPSAFEPDFRGVKPAATPSDPAAAASGPAAAPEEGAPGLTAEVVAAGEYGERTLRFAPVEDFWGALERIGHMPLPPYIRREQAEHPDPAEDRERYQTVYAEQLGSAAAPTAGLHFTPEILDALRARGVEIATLTLHVGLGTFQPVRVADLKDIRLHSERYTLPAATAEALNRAQAEGRRVIAVGTTTTRVLEHVGAEAAADGVPTALSEGHGKGAKTHVPQAGAVAFTAKSGTTSIFIGPGHRFRVVSGLLTNFHLPESTLLMLVAAFAGDGDEGRRRVLAAYAHAVREGYRFYSYGDCMLMLSR